MIQIIYCTFIALLIIANVQSQGAGECAAMCNDMRTEVLTMEMCRLVYISLFKFSQLF